MVNCRFFDAAQCHRCKRFGHGSRNCTLSPVCVKCGAAHLTGECTLPQKASLGMENNAENHKPLVKCANCQGNHTANYRGCPARKTYLEALEKQRKKPAAQPPRITISTHSPTSVRPAPPGWGRTYASVAAGSSSTSASPEAGTNGDRFTREEFFRMAEEMYERFQECHTKGQQLLALAELMNKYVFN